MKPDKRELQIYGKAVQIISKTNDCTIYRIAGEKATESMTMTSYSIFPGIEMIFNEVSMERCSIDRASLGNIIEINHCLEGRIECEYKGNFFYLTPGNVSVNLKDDSGHESYFPTGHYRGITIMININTATISLSDILDDVNIIPSVLMNKYSVDKAGFIFRQNESLKHIFSEIYTVPPNIRKGYFKIKTMEILLFLSWTNIINDYNKSYLSKTQVDIAKAACKYLYDKMDKHITIESLAEQFNVSVTYLKTCFKGVYGKTIYKYTRETKMVYAGKLLTTSNMSILEVAGRIGYDNGSKFAKAFKGVMQMNPKEYRKAFLEPKEVQMEQNKKRK